jgi:antitoxin ParD1/3/4
MKHTHLNLGNHFDEFISDKVNSGKYNPESEVIQSALRILEEEENEIELIKALEGGEKSGFVDNFNSAKNKADLHKRHL